MKLITSKKPKIEYKNQFVIEVETMLGDGDAYDKFLSIHDTLKSATKAVEALEAGYVFDTTDCKDILRKYPDINEVLNVKACDLPRCYDSYYYHEIHGYEVYYYDKNGVKFDVEVNNE